MARPTKAQEVLIRERRAAAVRLRVLGAEPLTIGKKLAADPALNSDGVGYPQGYGAQKFANGEPPPSDKRLIVLVCQDLAEARKAAKAAEASASEDLAALQNERLERLTAAYLRPAIGGPNADPDPSAATVLLKVMERQARLNGLDAPSQTHLAGIAGAGGNPIEVVIDSRLMPQRMDTDQPPVEQA